MKIRFKQTGFNQKKEIKMSDKKLTFFTPEEVAGLDEEFAAKLDLARKFAQIPFIITSGLRTLAENEQTPGAAKESAHLSGHAVDLRVGNSHEVYLIVAAGLSVGITRFGIYVDENNVPTHVHVDDMKDDLHVSEVIWIKREGASNTSIKTA